MSSFLDYLEKIEVKQKPINKPKKKTIKEQVQEDFKHVKDQPKPDDVLNYTDFVLEGIDNEKYQKRIVQRGAKISNNTIDHIDDIL